MFAVLFGKLSGWQGRYYLGLSYFRMTFPQSQSTDNCGTQFFLLLVIIIKFYYENITLITSLSPTSAGCSPLRILTVPRVLPLPHGQGACGARDRCCIHRPWGHVGLQAGYSHADWLYRPLSLQHHLQGRQLRDRSLCPLLLLSPAVSRSVFSDHEQFTWHSTTSNTYCYLHTTHQQHFLCTIFRQHS